MEKGRKFAIRLVLSVLFAFIVTRIFFQGTTTIKVLGLALIFFALAYVFEYLRRQA
jgi:hypothetical protein